MKQLTTRAVVTALAMAGAVAVPVQAHATDHRPSARYAEILREDPTAALDSDGRLYYTEPIPDRPHAARVSAQRVAAAFPLRETFDLHSAPGSNRTIYLDFDGETISGTDWNDEGLPAGTHPAWTLDDNAASFNDHERTVIQEIWARVAEDYAPFDVDVTTTDPGTAGIVRSSGSDQVYGTRALVTPSAAAWQQTCDQECVGIAYLDVFDEIGGSGQPVWIFPQFYDDFIDAGGAKGIAETIAHEVGHNLNLSHDGDASGDYAEGHPPWAPIMGNSDNEPISQWSKGDYTGATNHQDDFAVIANAGLDRRTDEAGDSIGAAAATVPAGTAYITTRADKDFYDLGTCSGTVEVAATGASVGTDLDIQLTLFSSDGTQIASANPASAKVSALVASGMNATISTPVTEGTYVVSVDGVGNGNPVTGYDDYGSVGAYSLSVTGCDGTPGPDPDPDPVVPDAPTVVGASSGSPGGQVTASVRWTAPESDGGSPVTGYRIKATRWSATGRRLASGSTSTLPADQLSSALLLKKAGIWSFQVQALNDVGWSALSSPSKKVRGR